MRVTRRLNAATPILVKGDAPSNIPRERQNATITTILKQAAPIAADAGLMFVMEALNTKLDHIGISSIEP
jgi:hydroxypyruvate isomerase